MNVLSQLREEGKVEAKYDPHMLKGLYLYAELSDALESILGMKVDIVSESARKRPGFIEEISKDLINL